MDSADSLGESRRRTSPPLPLCLDRTSVRLLHAADAGSLNWLLNAEVQRYLPDVPKTPARLAQYAAWAARQTDQARQLCLVIMIGERPMGLIQGWALNATGTTIEWGFALARHQWGHGLLQEAGRAFLTYAVDHLQVERIEARTAVGNARAIAALRRLGARSEGMIPGGLADKQTDCFLWSIAAADVNEHVLPLQPVLASCA